VRKVDYLATFMCRLSSLGALRAYLGTVLPLPLPSVQLVSVEYCWLLRSDVCVWCTVCAVSCDRSTQNCCWDKCWRVN